MRHHCFVPSGLVSYHSYQNCAGPGELVSRRTRGTVAHLHGDDVVREREELLAKPVAVLLGPLFPEELDDLFAAGHERVAVPPAAVGLYVQ